MEEGDGGLVESEVVGKEGGVLPLLSFLSFSRTRQYCFTTQGCYPSPENTIPLPTPPVPGENCEQQLYRRAATAANEQQDYHSDPRCY